VLRGRHRSPVAFGIDLVAKPVNREFRTIESAKSAGLAPTYGYLSNKAVLAKTRQPERQRNILQKGV